MKPAAVAGYVNSVVSKLAANAPDRLRESARYLGGLQLAQGFPKSGLGGVAKLGDVLEHVGELPHIVDDDGIRVRWTDQVDGLQARLRFIARVVAPA